MRHQSKSAPQRGLPGWIWIGFGILLALCVPWYVSSGESSTSSFWAFPVWGAVVVGFAFLLAVFTAFVYLRVWRDAPKKGKRGG